MKRNSPISWKSQLEHVPARSEQIFIANLREVDETIGNQVSELFGLTAPKSRSIGLRISRRLWFECARLLRKIKACSTKILFTIWFENFGRFIVLRRDPRPQRNTNFEIHSLEEDFANLKKSLKSANASHWILVRQKRTLLKSAIPRLLKLAQDPNIEMVIGDSWAPGRGHIKRPKFTRFLARQVDTLGPVILARVEDLRVVSSYCKDAGLWPLALSLLVSESRVQVIPRILGIGALVTAVPDSSANAAVSLVQEELSSQATPAMVRCSSPSRRVIDYGTLAPEKFISIIIPTRGTLTNQGSYIVDALISITEKTAYSNYEVVIVADADTPQKVINKIEEIACPRIKLVKWNQEFNFSQKINLGAAVASGQEFVFLNDDVEVVSPNWLRSMSSLLNEEKIGYVGALLFFEDQTVQHGGHFYEGGAGHIGFKQVFVRDSLDDILDCDRIVSGVTAACSIISRELFESVGGFSEVFPGNYNDVDLALKIKFKGKNSAVAGQARLYHFESKSRNPSVRRSDLVALHRRWYWAIQHDSFHRLI